MFYIYKKNYSWHFSQYVHIRQFPGLFFKINKCFKTQNVVFSFFVTTVMKKYNIFNFVNLIVQIEKQELQYSL